MPAWTNSPPKDAAGPSLPLLRTPASKPLVAVVTSDDLIGTYTHFWHGHTIPCNRPDCEACRDSIPYRWHAYLSAYRPFDGLHFLFEMTAQASENFVTYRMAHGTLRGCLFEMRRHHSKPNGRLLVRCRPADLANMVLPKQPDLLVVLAVLWNLPLDAVTHGARDPDRRTQSVRAHAPKNPMNAPPAPADSYHTGDSAVAPIRDALNEALTDIPLNLPLPQNSADPATKTENNRPKNPKSTKTQPQDP